METVDDFDSLRSKLKHIGMMGQWYQRYDISSTAEEAKKLISELKNRIDEPCGMSRK